MKTKLARVLLFLSRKMCDWSDALLRPPADELPTVEEVQKIYQASLIDPRTINVTSSAQPPKPGDTVVVHCGDEELRYICESTEPSKDGIGYDCKLKSFEAVDVFAGEQFKTKPEEKGEE